MIRRAAHGRWFRRNHTLQQTEQPHGDAISNGVNAFAYEKLDPERHRRPETEKSSQIPDIARFFIVGCRYDYMRCKENATTTEACETYQR